MASETTGKIRCTSGTLEFNYVWPNGVSNYQKMIFDDHGHHTYDREGNHLGYFEGVDYDLQAVLNQPSQGGNLWINFYDGIYEMYGPYRVYGSTTLYSPDRKARLIKQKDTYLFINTDDGDARILDDPYGGIYKLNGNIRFFGLTFDCNLKHGSVAKFVHASNIVFDECRFQNAMYDAHVLEFACVKDSSISSCSFISTSWGWEYADAQGKDKTRYETIQIESSVSIASFPYCKFPDNKYSINNNCRNITILGCEFANVLSAIGNHQNKGKQDNIAITGVRFNNIWLGNPICFSDNTKPRIS